MEAYTLYLIKSTVWLTGFFLIYVLFLRNERFFVLNRIYLVSGILFSIILPFFTWHYTVVFPVTPTVETFEPQVQGITTVHETFPIQNMLLYIYLTGTIILIFRTIKQTLSVWMVIQKSERHHFNSAKVIRTDRYPASFSFFSFVFVNPSTDETETREIVNHEQEHIRQQHWIDLLLFEILRTIQWFNPVSWLYGQMIRQNHEYLADERALRRSSNPAVYRAALLNQMFGGPVISLANSFNYSINKKRFIMMKQITYSPFRKLKLLLVLPLMAGVFYAFATPEYKFVQIENTLTQPEPASTVNESTPTALNTDEKPIKGRVVTEDGKPLPGTSIIISGTSVGTMPDANGYFELKATDDTPVIFSFVGFRSVKVKPDFEKEMVVTMERETIGIGAVDVRINGMQIKSALIIVDGKEVNGLGMNDIDPGSIESISVLKNESATKTFGEKAKNGVVLITLKKGITTEQASGNETKVTGYAAQPDGEKVFMIVDEMPEFPGGVSALRQYLSNTVKYPGNDRVNGKQGKVYVAFVINKDGSVSDAKVARGIDPSLDAEALRVVSSLPKWVPGKQGGEPVRVSYTVPIEFKASSAPGTPTENLKATFNTSSGAKPLIVIDGLIPVNQNIENVDPGNIESVNIIKSEIATQKYGAKGKNGVVEITLKKPKEVFVVVEEMPEFPGGSAALRTYLSNNVKYPEIAIKNGIKGSVYVNFTVSKTGKVTDVKAERSVDPSLDAEAIRVVSSLPLWKPGRQRGQAVDVSFTIPVNFSLPEGAPQKAEGTGIIATNTAKKLIIVPNPAKDQVTITAEGTTGQTKLDVNVYDRYGKLIKAEQKTGPTFTLSISDLVTGTYFIQAQNGNDQYAGSLQVVH